MYICKHDFDLFDVGKCFSFNAGQVFSGHKDCVKSLIAMGYIYEYNYSKPAIRFTEVGIKFFEPEMENKQWQHASI